MGSTNRAIRDGRRALWRGAVQAAALLLALGSVLAPAAATAAGRVALVVGNSAYAHIGALPNPGNDAADVGAALRRLGFEVTVARDADRAALNDALRAFTRRSAGADVALVFYAGHGMEMDGVNYLLPVDARLERDTDVRFETVSLDDVLAVTEGAALRLVILDACRNNPLSRSMQRTRASRRVSRGSFGDLNEDLLGDETLVAYAAAAGTTADDGEGRNSPFTSALLAHLEQPLEILTLFRRVRAGVLAATDGRQRPHEYQSLVGEHYLGDAALGLDRDARRAVQRGLAAAGFDPGPPDGVFGPGTRAAIRAWQAGQGAAATGYLDGPAAATLGAPIVLPAETVFWESIRESANAAEFEEYLARWPSGIYATLATNRLMALRESPPPDVRPRDREPGEVFWDCDGCPEMVVIPGGGLALGQYEVTVGEYRAFASATGGGAGGGCFAIGVDGDSWRDPGFPQTDRHPVACVSWDDAQEYVSWLSRTAGAAYRLPTEAEWESAAARSQRGCDLERMGNEGTCPVGTYGSNAAGLSDMVGNLREWTEDCGEGDCGRRVVRGDSWGSIFGDSLSWRLGARYRDFTDHRSPHYGFRVARTLD